MLAQAAAKGLYAELREADVMDVLSNAPLGNAPLGNAPVENAPLGNAPLENAPLGNAPVGNAPVGSAPVGEVARYPLILAADVFCYFGALEDVFSAAHASLTPGGWLVCSVEELVPDSDGVLPGDTGGKWALQRQGRYTHSAAYIRDTATAASFQILRLDRETVRYEANAPVGGLLIVLQRVRHDA
jgi:predicted TPR repeat methyltransferase